MKAYIIIYLCILCTPLHLASHTTKPKKKYIISNKTEFLVGRIIQLTKVSYNEDEQRLFLKSNESFKQKETKKNGRIRSIEPLLQSNMVTFEVIEVLKGDYRYSTITFFRGTYNDPIELGKCYLISYDRKGTHSLDFIKENALFTKITPCDDYEIEQVLGDHIQNYTNKGFYLDKKSE